MNAGENIPGYYENKHAVIFGGAGFIGSNFVKHLLDAGARITVIDPCMPETGGCEENIAPFLNSMEWLREPVEEIRSLSALLKEADLVIDSMGFPFHKKGIADPVLDAKLNYTSHLYVVQALRESPVRTVYIGSRVQYGKQPGAIGEETQQLPYDPQGINKLAAETSFKIYSERAKYSCLSLRVGNCFGPCQASRGDDIGLIGEILRSVLSEETFELYGSPDRFRQIIFVRDLVVQALRLIPAAPSGFAAVNIVGNMVTIKSILETAISIAGMGDYKVLPLPESVARMDPGDTVVLQERLKKYIGEPEYTPLGESLAETIEYLKKAWKK